MDTTLCRFGTCGLSQYRQDWPQQIPTAFSGSPNNVSEVVWIINVAEFARSGILQGIILAASAIWLSYRLHKLPLNSKTKPSTIKWPYEHLSQAARAIALYFAALAYIGGQIHILNLTAVTYAEILGLLRLADDIHWRHRALHQVNFVLAAILLVLVAAQLLPCVQIVTSQCTTDASVVGAISSLSAAVFIASITPREWIPPKIDFEVCKNTIRRTPAPEETCSWFNRYCTYEWLTPLIWKGLTNRLDMASIPPLAWYDEPMYLLHKIQKARSISKTTFWTILRFQRKELMSMTLWISASSTLENVAPYAMFKLLGHIANPTAATYHPWIWLALIFMGPMTRSVLFQQYLFVSTRFCVRLRSGMTQELYHKALKSMEPDERPFKAGGNTEKAETKNLQAAQKLTSTGRLANLMAADINAICRARDIIVAIVGVPIGTVISLAGLYRMMGWVSVVGIVIMVLATPISIFLGRMMYVVQKHVQRARDARISLITEYLCSIRAIKYLAWEDAVINRIDDARAVEQKGLWRVAILQTIINIITQALPYLGLLVMFGLRVGMQKRRLDASTAFTAITLVTNIRRNARSASANSNKFTAAIVAFKRFDEYFDRSVPLVQHRIGPLRIMNASFCPNKTATFRLKNISLDFIEGGLNVITGQSGSGKSTLLLAILGEVYLENGSLTRPNDVAFASQSAWLQRATIRDNILFHSPMEKARYNHVIKACCLTVDLKEMPRGDMTMVGENGTSLSGGQMARVALARALYSASPLLLLDDIFSALDTKTSAEVWKHCFCSALLNNRTIVLVSQIPWISSQADLAILLDKGRVKSIEANMGIARQPVTIAQGLGAINSETQTVITPKSRLQPHRDSRNVPSGVTDDVSAKDIVNQELKASRRADRLTFFQYMKYFGNPILIAACLFGSLLSNASFVMSSYWMSVWVQAYEHRASVNNAYYMGFYGLFVFLGTLSVGGTIFVCEWGGWRAAQKLHSDFIRAIMSAPLSWFETVPIGRVTNRLSLDMSSIDRSLSSMLRSALSAILGLLFRIMAISSPLPTFIVPVLFASAIGIIVSEMYTRTAVILRRLTSAGQSPVFSHFANTLVGLPVIRATEGMHEAFAEDIATKLKVWSATAEANYNSNRWVASRIDLVNALISLLAGIIVLYKLGMVSAGLVGFSLQNATGISRSVLTLVRAMNDLELEMLSFHRVKEYVKIKAEEKDDECYPDEGDLDEDDHVADGRHVIPEAWPRSGEIEFRNVTVRYDLDGPNILTDINLKFKAGERVGLVGRTGSGKTTLVLSLLRFTNIVSGQILYDGIDVTKVPRHRLRQSVTMIPQEATLFSGSVRSNLDPTGFVSQERIERVFNSCKGISSLSKNKSSDETTVHGSHGRCQDLSLSSEVDPRGGNFSHGQRQVLSLCRALIRNSMLMLLDEATASMDYQADQGIQEVLRKELGIARRDRTLVTIAHRPRTIIDYDSVVVMGGGRVIEYGSPRDLYNARGEFYNIIYHSGELEELTRAISGK